ncbi:FixH family protein [Cytobacillus sp. NCCP-133]|uniref:FixH family protein n=1 Tax=Cytobacillus sp. NCCP-133 TaxID=766848 RepID=UPI00222F6344|nr:FixH family protein [Cytobacillus sp. NCCP-133]GLB61019.1 hypothetical protein NCCP133_31500 [Cytobacillus sp. NCCP-133]
MKKYTVILLSVILLAGCSMVKDSGKSENKLEVSIQTPQSITPHEEVTLKAIVTHGDEKVMDANDVVFEIWQSGRNDREMLKAEHQGDGIYSVKKSFPENGQYYVVAHVTARNMHRMPTKQVIAGTPENTVVFQEEEHPHSHVSINLKTDGALKQDGKARITAEILKEGKPLTNANVSFEVWQDEQQQSEYIEASESIPGEYLASKFFSKSGSYNIKVHVTKEEIHEHQLSQLTVK